MGEVIDSDLGDYGNPPNLNASVSGFVLEKIDTAKGTLYTVSLTLNFLNILPFEVKDQDLQIGFWIHYQNDPVLYVQSRGTFAVGLGMNSIPILAHSKPEFTEELLSLVGRISEGDLETPISIKDLILTGPDCPSWLEDIMRGQIFDFIIPPLAINSNILNI